MVKKIKLTDWILLGIAGVIDLIQEMRDPLDLFKNYYQNFYGFVPAKYQRYYLTQTLWRKIKNGELKKIKQGKKINFQLTELGWQKLVKKFPLVWLKIKKWDRKWRLVIFDIEEKSRKTRNFIRKILKELGFVQLQKSVWISPHDIFDELKKILKKMSIEGSVIFIETRKISIGDKILLKKFWDIESLNEEYKKIYFLLKKIDNSKINDDRQQILNNLRKKIIEVFVRDPKLPKEILPKDWWGDKTINLVNKLRLFNV